MDDDGMALLDEVDALEDSEEGEEGGSEDSDGAFELAPGAAEYLAASRAKAAAAAAAAGPASASKAKRRRSAVEAEEADGDALPIGRATPGATEPGMCVCLVYLTRLEIAMCAPDLLASHLVTLPGTEHVFVAVRILPTDVLRSFFGLQTMTSLKISTSWNSLEALMMARRMTKIWTTTWTTMRRGTWAPRATPTTF